ncbi:MAG: heterodisulfide reductase subunit A-like protein [Armatimonadetes bacterium]|nr:heterodisulfide reductase subunit A-like protein [Armatimonadota bacterium]
MSVDRGKRGLLLCVCQGTCPSFHQMNVFEVLNALRREKLIDWVGIHPQLCADDGDTYLKDLLRGVDDLEQLYVAGCDPTMQKKMYRFAFDEAGFDPAKHKGVDIRNMTTDQAIAAIKQLIAETEAQDA